MIHPGHVKLLQEAKSSGDVLFVAINSDESVRRLKGPSRPCLNENERASILSSLICVDHVFIFEDDTPINLIKFVRPDVLVKGADYATDQVVGKESVESYGGSVILMPLVDNHSTSSIIKRIIGNHSL